MGEEQQAGELAWKRSGSLVSAGRGTGSVYGGQFGGSN
jgi:hypothetical protein